MMEQTTTLIVLDANQDRRERDRAMQTAERTEHRCPQCHKQAIKAGQHAVRCIPCGIRWYP